MVAAQTVVWILTALVAGMALTILWQAFVRRGLGRHGSVRERQAFEHALKHLLTRKHDGRFASPESVAGALGIHGKAMIDLVTRMEAAGLIRTAGGRIQLTSRGEEWAVQVVRAHRLWERYLVDDANVPLHRIHKVADRAEHGWTADALEALEAHLGHPTTDPHGDPIPTALGHIDDRASTPLNQWPAETPAVVIHVEDEPANQMHTIFSYGLRPGVAVNIVERGVDNIRLSVNGRECSLPPALAAAVNVAGITEEPAVQDDTRPLSTLRRGDRATIVSLTDHCRGLTRRRLLDMGFTPGTPIEVEMADMIGAAQAYRVRNTVVALRKEQASEIRVKDTD